MSLLLTAELSKSILAVLEEGIAKLRIIQEIELDDGDCFTGDETVCSRIIDPNTFLKCEDMQGFLNKNMFMEEFGKMMKILQIVNDELEGNKTFQNLITKVDEMTSEFHKIQNILKNLEHQKRTVRKLERNLEHQVECQASREGDLESEACYQGTRKQDLEFEVERDDKYNADWIKSQTRQNEIKLNNTEMELKTKLLNITRGAYDAEDVHFKVCKFYRRRIREMQREADTMNKAYDSQMEGYEMKLQLASSNKSEFEQITQTERELYEKRQGEVNEYLSKKKKQAEDKKRMELQKTQILVIQAWWRGQMVRHYFGRFRAFRKRAAQIKKEFKAVRAKRKKNKK